MMLVVTDDGVGLVQGSAGETGFGRRLIRTIARQLHAGREVEGWRAGNDRRDLTASPAVSEGQRMSDPLRILIVEDEALLLMQLEMMLEDEGHIVVGTAMSSDEAISVADKTHPDLAFVDIHLLDGPTGLSVAQHLRTRRRDTRRLPDGECQARARRLRRRGRS